MVQGHDKRQHERIGADTPMSFRVPGDGIAGDGRILDSSAEGMRLLADHSLEPGTLVSIRVERGGAFPPIVTAARVVRCAPDASGGRYAIGCSLD